MLEVSTVVVSWLGVLERATQLGEHFLVRLDAPVVAVSLFLGYGLDYGTSSQLLNGSVGS